MSYGLALGAAYASMFPDTTDRVVVDGNVGDPHLDGTACAGMRSRRADAARLHQVGGCARR